MIGMSPRQLRRRLMLVGFGGMLAVGSITAGVAKADTVSMRGVMGFQPDYQSLGLCPCKPLSHPVMPWSVPTITKRISDWVETPDAVNLGAPKVALTYSLTTVGALDYVDSPGAKPVEVWAFGSPETPKRDGRAKVAPESRESVHFVVALYDPIADPMLRWNLYAAINSRLSTHLHGYDDLDLSNPSATYTAPDGSTTLYYAPDVLPMLKWREKWTTPERMAELDTKYRPRVEAAYDRPVHVPAPNEPEPELAEEETWSEPENGESDKDDQGSGLSMRQVMSTTPDGPSEPEPKPSSASDDESLQMSEDDDSSETSNDSPKQDSKPDKSTENSSAASSDSDTSVAPSDDSDDNEGGDE